jgi:hypothetical protein
MNFDLIFHFEFPWLGLNINGQTQIVLLGFTVFSDKSSYMASNHKAIIKEVLRTFGKSWKNVICLVGDNCPTNKVSTLKHFINIQALADKCGLPLVGCAAHWLNLAVQKYLEAPSYAGLLQKVCFVFND